MSQITTAKRAAPATHTAPVDEPLDQEVVEIRANFEARSPLDELVREVFPTTREQRCWVHKTANVLDKMPKKMQPSAKRRLHDIYLAPRRADAEESFGEFLALYGKKFPKACACLEKDREKRMQSATELARELALVLKRPGVSGSRDWRRPSFHRTASTLR